MRTGFALPRFVLRLAAFLLMTLALTASLTTTLASFNTPTVDGTIGAGEYGSHQDGQNQQTTPNGQTWYMTWDATNLYVGLSGANPAEAAVIYLDKNPIAPVNGGTNTDGTLTGFGYDNANFAALPFRANAVFYFKNGYNEYRTADGNNGWSNAAPIGGSYASNNAANTREIAIPWSIIGGLPAAFNWFGYATSSGGYLYGSVPTANPTGAVGTAARYEHYYTVNNTANTAFATLPFAHDSYTFNQVGNLNSVGTLNVYDFTMNSSGQNLTRDTGQWDIDGNFGVWGGTVDFGSTTSATVISGSLNLAAGGRLSLSSSSAATVSLLGNFTNNGATFTPGSTVLTFAGSGTQVITGTTSTPLYKLNVNMGTSQANILDVQSPITLSDGGLGLSNGTFKLSSASVITPFVAAPTIGATTGFWLNSPVTVTADYNWTLNGLLRVSAGTLNITNPSNQRNIKYGAGAAFQLDGGAVNLSGGLYPAAAANTLSYTQTGGTLTLDTFNLTPATRGFDLSDAGSTFVMSGGRIVLVNSTSNTQGDYVVKAGTYSVTGGTLQLGNSQTRNATKFYLNASTPVPNLYLDNTGTGPAFPTARIYNSPLAVNGDLTLTTGTILNGNNNTTNLSVTGNLLNNGTLSPVSGTTVSIGGDFTNSGTTNLAGTTFTFNGGQIQFLTLNNPTTFNNLTVGAGTTLKETVEADNATVSGTLTNNGIIRKDLRSGRTGLVSFGLTGVTLNITPTIGSGQSLHIDRYDVSSPHAGPTQATGKYWLIDTGGGISNYWVDLTFPTFNVPATTAQVCRYFNTGWSCGRTSGTSNSVTVANTFIKTIQEWTVGDNSPSAASVTVDGYPSPVAVGTPHSFTVKVTDGFGNPPTTYAGRINLSSSDSQAIFEPASYGFQPSDGGVKTFTATFQTGGTQNIRATDANNATLTGAQNGIQVQTLPVDHLSVSGPASLTIGQSATFTVTARDANNYRVSDYAGTLHFTSSDPAAALPPDYTFGPGDDGAHAFSLSFNTLGSQTLTATDTVSSTLTGSTNVQINPITTTLALSSSANLVPLGQAVTFTATLSPSATGTITFTNTTTNTPLGTATLTNGTASLTTSVLPLGQNVIQASYGGNSSYGSSSSNTVGVQVFDPAVCNPLVVTQATDDGGATACGTFSYALLSASPGMTVTFALSGTNTIVLSGALTPTVKSGVTIDGGDCTSQARIVINGAGTNVGVAHDGLRLAGHNRLINLWIRGFKGPQVLIGPPVGGANQFRCTRWGGS